MTLTERTVTVRYFAAARAAAGTKEEFLVAPTIAALVKAAEGRHGARLAAVLGVASFLVDGLVWHDLEAPLPPGSTVDVLPPFAGG